MEGAIGFMSRFWASIAPNSKTSYYSKSMIGGLKPVCLLLGLAVLSAGVFPQEERSAPRSIPDTLLRPEKGETPRYPKDVVIGELGQGESPEEAYSLAKNILSALTAGTGDAPVLAGYNSILTESLREEINSLESTRYRIGGGRVEADGSVSFLVRFLGPEESISGELFLRWEGTQKTAGAPKTEETPGAEEIPEAEKTLEAEEIPGAEETTEISGAGEINIASPAGEGKWVLDDLILETKRTLTEIRDSYRYDFSPYERFY